MIRPILFAMTVILLSVGGLEGTADVSDAALEARIDAEVERLAALVTSLERDDLLPEAVRESMESVSSQLAAAGPEVALPLRCCRLQTS